VTGVFREAALAELPQARSKRFFALERKLCTVLGKHCGVGALYCTVLVPVIVNPGREEQGLVSMWTSWGVLPIDSLQRGMGGLGLQQGAIHGEVLVAEQRFVFRCALEALEMTLEGGCKPEIFHSDQGCQFTSSHFLTRLYAKNLFETFGQPYALACL